MVAPIETINCPISSLLLLLLLYINLIYQSNFAIVNGSGPWIDRLSYMHMMIDWIDSIVWRKKMSTTFLTLTLKLQSYSSGFFFFILLQTTTTITKIDTKKAKTYTHRDCWCVLSVKFHLWSFGECSFVVSASFTCNVISLSLSLSLTFFCTFFSFYSSDSLFLPCFLMFCYLLQFSFFRKKLCYQLS